MQVQVLCFGHLADYFGSDSFEVSLPLGAKVSDLVAELERREPRAQALGKRCRFALNEEYTTLDAPLWEGCTVAALPPMSGG
jgi:molybdopterin converting factor subunit 1